MKRGKLFNNLRESLVGNRVSNKNAYVVKFSDKKLKETHSELKYSRYGFYVHIYVYDNKIKYGVSEYFDREPRELYSISEIPAEVIDVLLLYEPELSNLTRCIHIITENKNMNLFIKFGENKAIFKKPWGIYIIGESKSNTVVDVLAFGQEECDIRTEYSPTLCPLNVNVNGFDKISVHDYFYGTVRSWARDIFKTEGIKIEIPEITRTTRTFEFTDKCGSIYVDRGYEHHDFKDRLNDYKECFEKISFSIDHLPDFGDDCFKDNSFSFSTYFGTSLMHRSQKVYDSNVHIEELTEEQKKVLFKGEREKAFGLDVYAKYAEATLNEEALQVLPEIQYKMSPIPLRDTFINRVVKHFGTYKYQDYIETLLNKFIIDNTSADTRIFDKDIFSKLTSIGCAFNASSAVMGSKYNYFIYDIGIDKDMYKYLFITDKYNILHSCVIPDSVQAIVLGNCNERPIDNSEVGQKFIDKFKSYNTSTGHFVSEFGITGYDRHRYAITRKLNSFICHGCNLAVDKNTILNFAFTRPLVFKVNDLHKINTVEANYGILQDIEDKFRLSNANLLFNKVERVSLSNTTNTKAVTVKAFDVAKRFENVLRMIRVDKVYASKEKAERLGLSCIGEYLDDDMFVSSIDEKKMPKGLSSYENILYNGEDVKIVEYEISRERTRNLVLGNHGSVIDIIDKNTGEVLKTYKSKIKYNDYIKLLCSIESTISGNNRDFKGFNSLEQMIGKVYYSALYVLQNEGIDFDNASNIEAVKAQKSLEDDSTIDIAMSDCKLLEYPNSDLKYDMNWGYRELCGYLHISLDANTGYLYAYVKVFDAYRIKRNSRTRHIGARAFGSVAFKVKDLDSGLELISKINNYSIRIQDLINSKALKEINEFKESGFDMSKLGNSLVPFSQFIGV